MKYLTPHEIADILQISYEKALEFVKFSGVPYVRIDRQYRVEESAFKTFLTRKGNIHIDLSEKKHP